MKKPKTTLLPIVLFLILSLPAMIFQSCEPDDCDDENNFCDTCIKVLKPNIYIYPERELQLDVSINFPRGGAVTLSIPEYGNGWSISVDTFGKIDDKYDYLFYESEQPDVCQMNKGWSIKQDSLTMFFTQNLKEYGFKGREIDDFIEFWIPRLKDSEYYQVYPQTNTIIDSVIELTFSEMPDNILRLFYLIEESNANTSLQVPQINAFKREGFFVTEWGVILR
uniref:hypothetical protein n=1 Tax=uncultured Draconibacterium sp. TaxID=1573823 RepID=UPI00321779CC